MQDAEVAFQVGGDEFAAPLATSTEQASDL